MDVYCRVETWGEMYSHTQGEEKEGNIDVPWLDIETIEICATRSLLVLNLPEVY